MKTSFAIKWRCIIIRWVKCYIFWEIYWVIGDILLEKTENSGELFGGDMGEYKKAKEDKNGGGAEMMCEKGEEDPEEGNGEGDQKQADQADDVQVIFFEGLIWVVQ